MMTVEFFLKTICPNSPSEIYRLEREMSPGSRFKIQSEIIGWWVEVLWSLKEFIQNWKLEEVCLKEIIVILNWKRALPIIGIAQHLKLSLKAAEIVLSKVDNW